MKDEALLNISLRVAVPAEHKQAAHFHVLQVVRYFRGEIDYFSVPPGANLDIPQRDKHIPTLEDKEREAVSFALRALHDEPKYEVARALGCARKTLDKKIAKYDL